LKEKLRQIGKHPAAVLVGLSWFSLAIYIPASLYWRRRRDDKAESKRVSTETNLPFNDVFRERRKTRRQHGGEPTPRSDYRANL